MRGNVLHVGLLSVLGLLGFVGAGCVTSNVVSPVLMPYAFIAEDPELAPYRSQVYNELHLQQNPNKVAAHFSAPAGSTICFEGSVHHTIGAAEGPENLMFGPGVYPFVLRAGAGGPASLCGAMMVVNVDETVGLATFGKAAETKLFSDDLIAKARSGVLAKAVLKFDEKPVIFYWLGNRTHLPAPGEATVELDFSGTEGISGVWVNGEPAPGAIATVGVREVGYQRVARTGAAGGDMSGLLFGPAPAMRSVLVVTKLVHKLELQLAGGGRYVGYIRNLEANALTTFMRVPCAIPAALFAAAEKGTIAKYSVTTGGAGEKQAVAEIVFGRQMR